jgi:phosphate transport system substrate-binding protein
MSQANSTDRSKICPKCEYDLNHFKATKCELCGTSLVEKQKSKIIQTAPITTSTNRNQKTSSPRQKAKSKQNLTSKTAAVELILKNKTKNWLNYVRQTSLLNSFSPSGELLKTTNLIGLSLIGLMLVLWANYLFLNSPQPEQRSAQKTTEAVAPQGVFNYGGAPIFAPLVASGLNFAVANKYPGFETRYTKPLNGDFSVDNAIVELINGELSFVYSDRPLRDNEYKKAQLRSFGFGSMPIAIEGLVLYSNIKTPVSQLNREQVARIFRGEITNWNQIDSQVNLPITPVVVKNETTPGIEVKTPKIQYTDNYTLALRKVISTPGAISFASASLVQNQQLVKMFALADGNSQNYIKPWVNEQVNLKAFKEGLYPLTRRIYLFYRIDGSTDQKAAEAQAQFFKSERGQQIIQKSGFVSIY